MLSKVGITDLFKEWLLTECSGYSFAQPTSTAISSRPAFGGTCYTPIFEATPVLVTQYGSEGVTATSTFSATVTNAQAYAYPFDGFAFGVAEVPSITSASSSASSTATAASSVHTVSNMEDDFDYVLTISRFWQTPTLYSPQARSAQALEILFSSSLNLEITH